MASKPWRMNQLVKRKWMTALRLLSNDSRMQMVVKRGIDPTTYNCLKILSQVYLTCFGRKKQSYTVVYDEKKDLPLKEVIKWAEVSSTHVKTLKKLTKEGKTYLEIADYIRKNL